jgi:predicted anti-sigma-YlaC factor YlaD
MDCRKFLEELSDFIDGQSTIGIREAIQEHIALCKKCEVLYSSTQRTLRIVGDHSEETFELPADASARLYDRLRTRLKELEK